MEYPVECVKCNHKMLVRMKNDKELEAENIKLKNELSKFSKKLVYLVSLDDAVINLLFMLIELGEAKDTLYEFFK